MILLLSALAYFSTDQSDSVFDEEFAEDSLDDGMGGDVEDLEDEDAMAEDDDSGMVDEENVAEENA